METHEKTSCNHPGKQMGEDCVMFQLRCATRIVARRYEEALKPVGLKSGQFSLLAALLDGAPAPLGRVADALCMDRTTLTRNLRPLEERGLVASMPHPEDGRIRALQITAAGHAVMRDAVPLWQEAQKESFAHLPEARWKAVKSELKKLAAEDAEA